MNSDQRLIDAYHAREEERKAAEWKRNKENQERYESAAQEAHKIRLARSLISTHQVSQWNEMSISSKKHLIADAQIVATNPSITEPELRTIYQERLVAWGDTDNPDLGAWDRSSENCEKLVLTRLKEILNR